jgi:hypothetical protein
MNHVIAFLLLLLLWLFAPAAIMLSGYGAVRAAPRVRPLFYAAMAWSFAVFFVLFALLLAVASGLQRGGASRFAFSLFTTLFPFIILLAFATPRANPREPVRPVASSLFGIIFYRATVAAALLAVTAGVTVICVQFCIDAPSFFVQVGLASSTARGLAGLIAVNIFLATMIAFFLRFVRPWMMPDLFRPYKEWLQSAEKGGETR